MLIGGVAKPDTNPPESCVTRLHSRTQTCQTTIKSPNMVVWQKQLPRRLNVILPASTHADVTYEYAVLRNEVEGNTLTADLLVRLVDKKLASFNFLADVYRVTGLHFDTKSHTSERRQGRRVWSALTIKASAGHIGAQLVIREWSSVLRTVPKYERSTFNRCIKLCGQEGHYEATCCLHAGVCRVSLRWPNTPLLEDDDDDIMDKLLQPIVAVVPSFPFEMDDS